MTAHLAPNPAPASFLSSRDLAYRWLCSDQSIRVRRMRGDGPRYLKLGRRVFYRLEDVEAYEAERMHATTSEYRQATEPASVAR